MKTVKNIKDSKRQRPRCAFSPNFGSQISIENYFDGATFHKYIFIPIRCSDDTESPILYQFQIDMCLPDDHDNMDHVLRLPLEVINSDVRRNYLLYKFYMN